ncbi:YcjX family protein [Paraglaciecola aestuariivivens]
MQNSFLAHPKVKRTTQKLSDSAARLLDQQVNLAVTGLSGSGKTAFITSLVNQLLEANHGAQLPFFSIHRDNRLVGVKRDIQPNLSFSRFAYEDAMQQLTAEQPKWPGSTTGISQIRLKIKFKRQAGLGKLFKHDATLTLDITDYPGEWLLDLPLLELTYSQWCKQCEAEWQDATRNALAQDFLKHISELDLTAQGDELALQHIAQLYTEYLTQCQAKGFQLLQPGRFILPGELAGAPALHFFPIPQALIEKYALDLEKPAESSHLALLIQRFEHYKKQVVKPFYTEHFKHFDRQVVLVDCLSALNRGFDSYQDLQKALDWIMTSFEYGSSNILNRLFQPKIDKLVFAASKADHITPDQQENLVKLLESMLHESRKQLQFEGVGTESTAISAIRASQSSLATLEGKSIPVLEGRNHLGESIRLFPGEVPKNCPKPAFWQEQQFAFPKFSPPLLSSPAVLPHIRMDQVLDFLLEDKLR